MFQRDAQAGVCRPVSHVSQQTPLPSSEAGRLHPSHLHCPSWPYRPKASSPGFLFPAATALKVLWVGFSNSRTAPDCASMRSFRLALAENCCMSSIVCEAHGASIGMWYFLFLISVAS